MRWWGFAITALSACGSPPNSNSDAPEPGGLDRVRADPAKELVFGPVAGKYDKDDTDDTDDKDDKDDPDE